MIFQLFFTCKLYKECALIFHLEQFAALQAAIILVTMASGKNIWRLKFWWKSPIGNQKIKRKTYQTLNENQLGVGIKMVKIVVICCVMDQIHFFRDNIYMFNKLKEPSNEVMSWLHQDHTQTLVKWHKWQKLHFKPTLLNSKHSVSSMQTYVMCLHFAGSSKSTRKL